MYLCKMKGIIEIADFYKPLKFSGQERINGKGHFNIIRVEDIPLHQGKSAEYLRRSYYKISVVSGHSRIRYPNHQFEINGPALVFTHPRKPYQWERISKNHTGYVCIFDNSFLSHLASADDFSVFSQEEHSVITLEKAQADNIENIFKSMLEELGGSFHLKYSLLALMLLELIYRGEKQVPSSQPANQIRDANERIVEQFFGKLEQQFPIEDSTQRLELIEPRDFARQLNIHVNHLNKALKKITGKSTSALISERLILEAKNLLVGTSWTVGEISWALGFEAANHFSAFFKRNTTISPFNYRKGKID